MTAALTTPITDGLLICCALAWKANPLAGLDLDPHYTHHTANTTRNTYTADQILNWRSTIEPTNHEIHWKWARRAALRHFPTTLGVNNLPTDHEEALGPAPQPPAHHV